METKVRPPGMLSATVIRRLADTAVAWGRLEGKPSFRFGLSTVRFGLISVAVIALGAALLTWLPSDAYNQPITHPVKAIADSVTKEPPKTEENKATSVVRKGLEAVGSGILNPGSDQPASPSSVAPTPQAPAPAPKALAPAPKTPALASRAAPTLAPPVDTPASYPDAAPAPAAAAPAPAYEAPAPAATPDLTPAYETPAPSEESPPDRGASPTNPPGDPATLPSPQAQVRGCEPPNCSVSLDPGTNSEPAPTDSPSGPGGSTPK